jgi:hypothetical protein
MTIRLFCALLCGAAFLFATQVDPAQAETTVKSSKSNTSDRMGGGGGTKAGGTVTNRMGGGGGGKGAATKAKSPRSGHGAGRVN